MRPLTDPAFLRCKYTSYVLLAGAFLLGLLILLQTGVIAQPSPASPATALSSGMGR